MANGDYVRYDPNELIVKLLDAQIVTHDGVWVEIPARYVTKTFWASNLEEGAADATVDIMVSNAETKPSDATNGLIDLAMSTPSALAGTKSNTYRWIKAKKTQGTTPAATTIIMVAARGN